MRIKQTKRFTISWHWPYWRQWYVVAGDTGTCFGLGPLGVTVWRRAE